MKPGCDCLPCQRRRATQNRWLNKTPGRKKERMKRSNEIRAKRRAESRRVSDSELDRRALQSWRPEWSDRRGAPAE